MNLNWLDCLKIFYNAKLNKDSFDGKFSSGVIKESADSTFPNILFPITKEKMYGGSIMASAISEVMKDRPENFSEILNFNTCFYSPTPNSNHSSSYVVKKGRNFEFKDVYFYSDEKKEIITAKVNILIEKNDTNLEKNQENKIENSIEKSNLEKPAEFKRKPQSPRKPKIPLTLNTFNILNTSKTRDPNFKLNPHIDNSIEALGFDIQKFYISKPFDTFMMDFFRSFDENFDNKLQSLKENSGFLFFLEFLTATFDLKVINEKPFTVSYSVPEMCPESEITPMIVYLIDILMVCFSAIPNKVPIYDPKKIIFSSIEHHMRFIKKMNCAPKRKGTVEFPIELFVKRSDSFFVYAHILNDSGEVFCHAFQLVYLINLEATKSKL